MNFNVTFVITDMPDENTHNIHQGIDTYILQSRFTKSPKAKEEYSTSNKPPYR